MPQSPDNAGDPVSSAIPKGDLILTSIQKPATSIVMFYLHNVFAQTMAQFLTKCRGLKL